MPCSVLGGMFDDDLYRLIGVFGRDLVVLIFLMGAILAGGVILVHERFVMEHFHGVNRVSVFIINTALICPASKQVVYTPRWAVPVLPHVRIHMLSPNGPSKLGKVEAGSLLSLRIHLPKGAPGCQTQDSATGTSTSPTWPLASDWVTTPAMQPKDFSACYLNLEDPFQ